MQSSDIELILPLRHHQWTSIEPNRDGFLTELTALSLHFFSLSKLILFPFVPFSFSVSKTGTGENEINQGRSVPRSNTRHDVKSSTINPRGLLVSRTTDTQRCIENEKRRKRRENESILPSSSSSSRIGPPSFAKQLGAARRPGLASSCPGGERHGALFDKVWEPRIITNGTEMRGRDKWRVEASRRVSRVGAIGGGEILEGGCRQ